MTLSVLSVASEMVPLIKTGGLADVAGALPGAVVGEGVAMSSFVPGYPAVMRNLSKKAKVAHTYTNLFGVDARIVKAEVNGAPLFVLDAPAFFDRDGGPYADHAGHDWNDNWRRFAAFSRAAADLASGGVKGEVFDILHAHDWQAALAPAYLRYAPSGPAPKSVMTIHNMAFQGYYSAEVFGGLGLPPHAFAMDGVEYHGGVGYLKAGMECADAITTVSPTYAREIRSAEFGMGLEGLVQNREGRVHGIVNGIDTALWDSATDPAIKVHFTAKTLSKRPANKRAVEKYFGLKKNDGPLFILISRLSWQKGIDVVLECVDHIIGLGGSLAVLGSGDGALEAGLLAAADRHPGRMGVRIGYDEGLSHLMQAGGDAILVPSRFEPCGLTQLYGLAYGCIPVVARTGGLADTVIDANVAALNAGVATGVQFVGVHYAALAEAITRTVHLHHDGATWKSMQRAAMASDFSWTASGRAYADLYKSLL